MSEVLIRAGRKLCSDEQQGRRFEKLIQCAEELCTDGSVEEAVVAAESHHQAPRGEYLAVLKRDFLTVVLTVRASACCRDER